MQVLMGTGTHESGRREDNWSDNFEGDSSPQWSMDCATIDAATCNAAGKILSIWLLALISMIKHSCLIPRRPSSNPIWNCSNMKSAPPAATRYTRFSERLNCNWNVYSISAIPTELFFFRTRFIFKFPFSRSRTVVVRYSRVFNPFIVLIVRAAGSRWSEHIKIVSNMDEKASFIIEKT